MNSVRRLLLTAALAAACAPAAMAGQISATGVTGLVVDAQGGVVPGATVLLVAQARPIRVAPATTTADGRFTFASVQPGRYRLEISKRGFTTLVRSDIRVIGGEQAVVEALALQVAGPREMIDVRPGTSSTPTVSGVSFTVDPAQVESLPLTTHDFQELLSIVPGVNGTSRIGGGGQDLYTIDGVSAMDTGNNGLMGGLNLPVDAISDVKVLTSGYQAEYGRSSGLQVVATTRSGTNQFKWSLFQYGRNSAWNENSWANSQNGAPKAVSRQAEFGAMVGGPIGKPGRSNSLFFFYSQELRPRISGRNTNYFRLPTDLERRGDFSETRDQNGALLNLIYDAASGLPKSACSAKDTRACFQDGLVLGRIPLARLYGPGLALLHQYPLPNVDATPGRSYNYRVTSPVQFTLTYTPVVRLDYRPDAPLQLTFKWAGQNARATPSSGSLPGYNDTLQKFPLAFTASATVHYAWKTGVVEATYGMTRNRLGAPPIGRLTNRDVVVCPPDVASTVSHCSLGDLPSMFPNAGIIDPRYYEYAALQDIGAPFFVGGQSRLPPQVLWAASGTTSHVSGGPPSLPFPGFMNINRIQDFHISLTNTARAHTVKAGLSFQHSYKAQNVNSTGTFQGVMSFGDDTTNPLDSGFPFANAALGVFSSYAQQSRFAEGQFVYDNLEGYLQDHWAVSRRVTLELGVRVVHQTPQVDTYDPTMIFSPDRWTPAAAPLLYLPGCSDVSLCIAENRQAKDPRTGALLGPGTSGLIGQTIAGTGDPANGMRVADFERLDRWPALAVAPRIGGAFDLNPGGRHLVVIRGSVGLFYDRPDGNSVFGTIANPPRTTGTTQQWGRLGELSTDGRAVGGVPTLRGYDYGTGLPADVQWNAGAQVGLPWQSTLDANYVGHHAYDVLGGQQSSGAVDLNTIDLGSSLLASGQDPTQSAGTSLPNNLLRAYRGYNNILMQWGRFDRTFHSLQMSFTRRMRKGLSAGVNWTYSISDKGTTGLPGPQLRLDHAPDGHYVVRADQATAESLFADQGLMSHLVVANFVWTLPEFQRVRWLPRRVEALAHRWQLSGVFRYDSGPPYDVTYSYQSGGGARLTGSPDFNARIVIAGNPGSGCSSDQYRQFNTAAFRGPLPGSVGLESGRFLLHGCGDHRFDLVGSRDLPLRGALKVQLRVEAFNLFNAVIYSGRNTSMQLTSPTNQTVRNAQFLDDGTIDPGRLQPNQAGFGAATAALSTRAVQIQLRLKF